MTTHKIDIEGLPEGWELEGVSITPSRTKDINDCWRSASVKLRRIKPRRIVLEETGENTNKLPRQGIEIGDTHISISSNKIWRIKEE